jgi:hypothetical protein
MQLARQHAFTPYHYRRLAQLYVSLAATDLQPPEAQRLRGSAT